MTTVFTKILNKEIPGHIIYEDDNFFALLDIFPKGKGHTLLIPKLEVVDLFELPDDLVSEIMVVAKKISSIIKETLEADAIKLMQNNGKAAGQEVMHYHLHIIPFYEDSSKNNDKENLEKVAERLKRAFK